MIITLVPKHWLSDRLFLTWISWICWAWGLRLRWSCRWWDRAPQSPDIPGGVPCWSPCQRGSSVQLLPKESKTMFTRGPQTKLHIVKKCQHSDRTSKITKKKAFQSFQHKCICKGLFFKEWRLYHVHMYMFSHSILLDLPGLEYFPAELRVHYLL